MAAPEQNGSLLTRTLSGPDLTDAALDRLHGALDAAEATARILVLRGAPPVFCTGMAVAEAARESDPRASAARFFSLLRRFTTSPVVVVAVVEGRAAGGGVGLAAACDVVLATDHSSFSLPELLWGLVPCCAVPFVVRRAGFQAAYTMTVAGRTLSALEAERAGLVDHRCADPGPLLARLERRIARTAPSAVAEAKAYFGRLHPIGEDTERRAVDELCRLMSAPAFQHAVRDFATTGRPPWSGVL